jgi:hypothetical protein
VRFSGALKKRHRGRRLTAERGKNPKERTRGNYGSRKRLTVAGGKMTRRAGMAWRKRKVIRKKCTRDRVEQEARRVRMLRKRLQKETKRQRELENYIHMRED